MNRHSNNTRFETLLAGLLMSASLSAFAAGSADLSVKGSIKPTACNVSLDGGAVIDFGVIPARSLSENAFTRVGTKRVTLTVTCDANTKLALAAADGRAGTQVSGMGAFLYANQNDAATYGVGTAGTKKVGGYILYRETNPTVDTVAGSGIISNDQGLTWSSGNGAGNAITPTRWHGFAATGATVPGAFKTIVQPYNVMLGLNRKSDLPALTNDVPIDGLATFTIKYL